MVRVSDCLKEEAKKMFLLIPIIGPFLAILTAALALAVVGNSLSALVGGPIAPTIGVALMALAF